MNITVNHLYWLVAFLFFIVYWLFHMNLNLRATVKRQDQHIKWQDKQLTLLGEQVDDTRQRMDTLNKLIETIKH